MPTNSGDSRNWFDDGGKSYARFRPEYPPQLAEYLSSVSPDTQLGIDVGCGNGQLTQLLAAHFSHTIGIDPSPDQIANAVSRERVTYVCAPAEKLPVADQTASLICAAQAAHWFDLPSFYTEVRRVARPDAILALISYGVLEMDSMLNARFEKFYWNEIGPYWPPERKLVDEGYSTIDFPFEELSQPEFKIAVEWNLAEFLGYLSTWSAIKRAKEAGRDDLLMEFAQEISAIWGSESVKRSIQWPIKMRIGRIRTSNPA